MNSSSKGTAVITGASSGIGAIYADRLARRGHDLILVARNRERLDGLARRLTDETGRSIQVFPADLNDPAELASVENLLRQDRSITALVNNAGFGAATPLLASDVARMTEMISLNVSALTRLTYAAVPGFVERGGGTIINVASIVAVAPEILNGVYGGTKAYVLAFTRSLHHELAAKGLRVQAVLPGAIATEFWDVVGHPVDKLPSSIVMSAMDLVDAALAGLDQGEIFTVPSLPDSADWSAYEEARQKLLPNLSRDQPAARYGLASVAGAEPNASDKRPILPSLTHGLASTP
ncbi:SDR family NAD(P)-dependent oxidoreductase [Dyella humicola]|uniref:SDR family NAD(P)-dependent oxidoreductase n=1 Tax=Dyella humicola TaxID=2992126 RepID=UPI002250CB1E|nr:SDR family oxidoreductase [Dyella humicola]